MEKNRFWLENPKILGKIFNLEIPNRSRGNGFQRGSTLEDPRVTHAGGSKRVGEPSLEACCMIDGWDLKHLWKRVRCPRCEDVFWKRYYKLYKRFSQNHANLTMTPTTVSSVAIYPHERDYVKSLCKNPGRALTSKCAKNDKNPHNCDCAL